MLRPQRPLSLQRPLQSQQPGPSRASLQRVLAHRLHRSYLPGPRLSQAVRRCGQQDSWRGEAGIPVFGDGEVVLWDGQAEGLSGERRREYDVLQ